MTPNVIHPPQGNHPSSESARMYTVAEVAELLRVSQWMVNKLVREEQLGSVKIGARRLVPSEDIDRFIAARRSGRIRGGFDG